MFGILKASARDFIDDDCPTMAAALSYYTVFALPPLLVLILLLVGALMDPQDVQGSLQARLQSLMGPGAGQTIRTILQHAQLPGSGGIIATVVGVAALVLGATGVFGQLQAALNRAWAVEPDPSQGGLRNFVLKRVFSFGMILQHAFLLLVSLVLSAAVAAFGNALGRILPQGFSATLLQAINFAISFAVITLLFAAIFRILPDARIRWRDVWVGATATALLFVIEDPDRDLPRPERSGPGLRRGGLARAAAGVDLLLLHDRAVRRRVHPDLGRPPRIGDRAGARRTPGRRASAPLADPLREQAYSA
jgi:membrane protein